MNNIISSLFFKMSSFAIKISIGLSLFYFFAGIFMLLNYYVLQAMGCFSLTFIFILFATAGKIANVNRDIIDRIISVIREIDQTVSIKNSDQDLIKLNLVLFDIDSNSSLINHKTITGVLWMNQQGRPTSKMIRSVILMYMNNRLIQTKYLLSSKEKYIIQKSSSILNQGLIEMHSEIIKNNPFILKTPNQSLIGFK